MAAPLVSLLATLIPQFYNSTGSPLSGGLLQIWAAGTTTPIPTYTDSTGATANTNPIVLNVNGNPQTGASVTCGIWGTQGVSYKVQLQTATGSPIWTLDNILVTGSFSFFGGTTTGSANAYLLAQPQISAYATPLEVTFIASFANTGPATLNINSLGAKNLYKMSPAGPVALSGGEIATNQIVTAVYDGTEFQITSPFAKNTQPTRQILTSGTAATYATPTGAIRLFIRAVGGGGGGGAIGGSGGLGGTTIFNAINAAGGGGGIGAASTNGQSGGSGGSGGSGTTSFRAAGNGGSASANAANSSSGAGGGSAFFGGAGLGVFGGNGISGAANTGGGASGGGGSAGAAGGGGGGGGECFELIINSPASTYTYTIGVGGVQGNAGGGNTAGVGGTGLIVVDEYYV